MFKILFIWNKLTEIFCKQVELKISTWFYELGFALQEWLAILEKLKTSDSRDFVINKLFILLSSVMGSPNKSFEISQTCQDRHFSFCFWRQWFYLKGWREQCNLPYEQRHRTRLGYIDSLEVPEQICILYCWFPHHYRCWSEWKQTWH